MEIAPMAMEALITTHAFGSRLFQPFKRTGLTSDNSILDVGCAKGFMMHDFVELIPGITVKGLDVSEYAVQNAIEDMRPHVQVADAKSLPYEDKSFDDTSIAQCIILTVRS